MPLSEEDGRQNDRTGGEGSNQEPVVEQRPMKRRQPGPLTTLIGGGKPDFDDSELIDVFIRAERRTWSS